MVLYIELFLLKFFMHF